MAKSGRKRSTTDQASHPREAIIAAAIAALADVGFSAASARNIAERAGVAPGGVFYHFGSMDELLCVVFDRCSAGRVARLGAALDVPTAEVPRSIAVATREEFALPESRALLEIVVGAISSPDLAEHVRRGIDDSLAFTAEAIRAATAETPAAAGLPVDLIAELAAAAFFGLEVLDHVGRRVDLDAAARLMELLTALLRRPDL